MNAEASQHDLRHMKPYILSHRAFMRKLTQYDLLQVLGNIETQ